MWVDPRRDGGRYEGGLDNVIKVYTLPSRRFLHPSLAACSPNRITNVDNQTI